MMGSVRNGEIMKHTIKLLIAALLIAFTATSCNLLFKNTDTPPAQVTPNMTLTALFDTSHNIPATITPGVANPTDIPPLPTVAVATNTTAPTFTLIPVVVATPVPPTPDPMIRPGGSFIARYVTTAPVLDGTYEEWIEKTEKYKLPYRVYGAGNWKNQADLEGAFGAVWDNTNLYISVKVTDDSYNQRKSGEMLYKGDSVEILIDANLYGDYYVQSLGGDDFQIGLSAGNPAAGINPEAYIWYPAAKKGTSTAIQMSKVFETGSNIYRVEAAIPWSLPGISPKDGLHIGFAVSISDNDSTTSDGQDTMISTTAYRNFLNPTTWGELILRK
jgi:hypothetical protein